MRNLNKIYLVKNLSPWIIDEINAMAEVTSFSLILLRKQPRRYYNELNKLENKISIYIKPWINKISYKRFLFSLSLLFSHITHFYGLKNFVFGIKALYWFNRLDLRLFPEPTSIHAQFATQPAIIAYFIKKYLNYNIEYSVTVHAHDIFYSNRWLKIISNEAKSLITISDYNINYLKKKYKINPEKIILSRLGVFLQLHKNPGMKSETGIFKVGLLSWFEEKKGIPYLLEAIKKISEEGKENIIFILAGSGKLMDFTKSFIKKFALEKIVQLPGPIFGKEKVDFFKNIDLFILPSVIVKNDMDGIPIVLMEAVNFGLPIVSTSISGISEICVNGYNGILIEEKNTKMIINSILFLLENKKIYSYYSQNSLALSKKYNIQFNSKEKLNLLNWI